MTGYPINDISEIIETGGYTLSRAAPQQPGIGQAIESSVQTTRVYTRKHQSLIVLAVAVRRSRAENGTGQGDVEDNPGIKAVLSALKTLVFLAAYPIASIRKRTAICVMTLDMFM
jgi:hypothetical protein